MSSKLIRPEEQGSLLELANKEDDGARSKAFWNASSKFLTAHSAELGLFQMAATALEWNEAKMQSYFSGKLETELIAAIFQSMDRNSDTTVTFTTVMQWMAGNATEDEDTPAKEAVDDDQKVQATEVFNDDILVADKPAVVESVPVKKAVKKPVAVKRQPKKVASVSKEPMPAAVSGKGKKWVAEEKEFEKQTASRRASRDAGIDSTELIYKKLKSVDLATLSPDGDRKVQKDEMLQYFADSGIAENVIEAVFDELDKNGDGTISALEFFQWRTGSKLSSFRELVRTAQSKPVAAKVIASPKAVETESVAVANATADALRKLEEAKEEAAEARSTDAPKVAAAKGPVIVESAPLEEPTPAAASKKDAVVAETPLIEAQANVQQVVAAPKSVPTAIAVVVEDIKAETKVETTEALAQKSPVVEKVVAENTVTIATAMVAAASDKKADEETEEIKPQMTRVTEVATVCAQTEVVLKSVETKSPKMVRRAKYIVIKGCYKRVPAMGKALVGAFLKRKGVSDDDVAHAFKLAAAELGDVVSF